MAPVFKTPEEALEALKTTRDVAAGWKPAQGTTTQQAQELYARYKPAMDAMIQAGQGSLMKPQKVQEYFDRIADTLPKASDVVAADWGGKTIGTIATVFTLGLWKDAREVASGAGEMKDATMQRMQKLGEKVKEFKKAWGEMNTTYTSLAGAILSGDEKQIAALSGAFNATVRKYEASISDLNMQAEAMGRQSEALAGAAEVTKSFAKEAAITVVTMGAINLAIKGIGVAIKTVPAVAEKAIEAGVISARVASGVRTFGQMTKIAATVAEETPVLRAGVKAAELGKEGIHGYHAAHTFEDDLKKHEQNEAKYAQ